MAAERRLRVLRLLAGPEKLPTHQPRLLGDAPAPRGASVNQRSLDLGVGQNETTRGPGPQVLVLEVVPFTRVSSWVPILDRQPFPNLL